MQGEPVNSKTLRSYQNVPLESRFCQMRM